MKRKVKKARKQLRKKNKKFWEHEDRHQKNGMEIAISWYETKNAKNQSSEK